MSTKLSKSQQFKLAHAVSSLLLMICFFLPAFHGSSALSFSSFSAKMIKISLSNITFGTGIYGMYGQEKAPGLIVILLFSVISLVLLLFSYQKKNGLYVPTLALSIVLLLFYLGFAAFIKSNDYGTGLVQLSIPYIFSILLCIAQIVFWSLILKCSKSEKRAALPYYYASQGVFPGGMQTPNANGPMQTPAGQTFHMPSGHSAPPAAGQASRPEAALPPNFASPVSSGPADEAAKSEAKPAFCHNCGAKLSGAEKFCGNCGTKIS